MEIYFGLAYEGNTNPGLPWVLRRFITVLLYPRYNPWEIMSGGLLPSHALPPAIYH
jgi:hypothetical protein